MQGPLYYPFVRLMDWVKVERILPIKPLVKPVAGRHRHDP